MLSWFWPQVIYPPQPSCLGLQAFTTTLNSSCFKCAHFLTDLLFFSFLIKLSAHTGLCPLHALVRNALHVAAIQLALASGLIFSSLLGLTCFLSLYFSLLWIFLYFANVCFPWESKKGKMRFESLNTCKYPPFTFVFLGSVFINHFS